MLEVISQFEKASVVAKLAAARKRKREKEGKCEGRKSHQEKHPQTVALARKLRRKRPKGGQLSLLAGRFRGTSRTWLSQRAWQAICGEVCGYDAGCLVPCQDITEGLASRSRKP